MSQEPRGIRDVSPSKASDFREQYWELRERQIGSAICMSGGGGQGVAAQRQLGPLSGRVPVSLTCRAQATLDYALDQELKGSQRIGAQHLLQRTEPHNLMGRDSEVKTGTWPVSAQQGRG